jgi:hypothetical protein
MEKCYKYVNAALVARFYQRRDVNSKSHTELCSIHTPVRHLSACTSTMLVLRAVAAVELLCCVLSTRLLRG